MRPPAKTATPMGPGDPVADRTSTGTTPGPVLCSNGHTSTKREGNYPLSPVQAAHQRLARAAATVGSVREWVMHAAELGSLTRRPVSDGLVAEVRSVDPMHVHRTCVSCHRWVSDPTRFSDLRGSWTHTSYKYPPLVGSSRPGAPRTGWKHQSWTISVLSIRNR